MQTKHLTLSLAGLLLLLLTLPSCSRVSVHALADPSADFASFKTFAFLPKGGVKKNAVPGPRTHIVRDPLFHAHIQHAVEAALDEKGYTRVTEPKRADLLIGYRTAVKDQAEVMPAVYGVGWRGRVHRVRPAQVKWYKEGTLVIDVVDRQSEHLVWRGIGVGAMRDMKPGGDLEHAVRDILGKLPAS